MRTVISTRAAKASLPWAILSSARGQLAIAVVLSSAACSAGSNGVTGGQAGFGVGGLGAVGSGGAVAVGVGGAKSAGGAGGAIAVGAGGAKSTAGVGGSMVGASGRPGGASGSTAGAGGSMAGAGGSMAGAGGTAGTTVPGAGGCLDGITDYENAGPFTFDMKMAGSVNIWVPKVPAGCKVPMVHLANGTTATCSAYQMAIERLASHGFLTLCYEDPNTGAGDQGIMAFDAAIAMYPDLADKKIGSTGHSQGGQAAFTVLQLAEAKYGADYIYAGLAMEPASGFGTQPTGGSWQMIYAEIKSPMFMFSGLGTDGLVSQAWVQQAYDAMAPTEEAYFWTANGATHIPTPQGEEEEISIPWFRWKLLGDQKACAFFKAIPMTNTKWAEVASKNSQPCM